MSLRSAVGPQRVAGSNVPSNASSVALMVNLGKTIGGIVNKARANNLSEKLVGQATENQPEQAELPPPEPVTLEQRQGQIAEDQVDLAEEQMINDTKKQAQEKREQVQKLNTWSELTSNPEMAENMLKLQRLDPQMAKGVAEILVSRDQTKINALQEQALQANRFEAGLAQLALDPKVSDSDIKGAIRNRAAQLQELGAPIDELAPLMSMSRDQLVSSMRTRMAMSQGAYKVAQDAKPILVGEKQRVFDPRTGEVILDSKQVGASQSERSAMQSRQRANDLRQREQDFKENKLTNVFERELIKSQDAARESEVNVSQLESVAQEYEGLSEELGSGQSAGFKESLKTFFGDEDAATNLRRRYNQIVNKKALDNLPPGAASEKDVEIVFKGFLKDTADPATVASFLRGLAKVESANANFQSFKAQYISDNRNTRGLQKAWKSELASQAQEAINNQQQVITATNPQTGQTITSSDGGQTWQ